MITSFINKWLITFCSVGTNRTKREHLTRGDKLAADGFGEIQRFEAARPEFLKPDDDNNGFLRSRRERFGPGHALHVDFDAGVLLLEDDANCGVVWR
jgi:hypothetical protein